ncbi:protein SMG9-like isoform X2 [Gigantopelta aegis]|uniref:protein SMG9-like isoform X2 n=1 Tax=Gigantopelta aegis TaxID=1735272 RepID=UPI001B888728|nr:protein SMG9-like isoform X2 [Gigantopelta aegis]
MQDMSDPMDRGGRRRKRRDRPGRKERERETDPSPTPSRPPIILGLVKPADQGSPVSTVVSAASSSSLVPKMPEKTIVVLRSRDENRPSPSTTTSTQQALLPTPGETTPTQPPYNQRHASFGHLSFDSNQQNRLAAPHEMKRIVNLIDDTFRWCDTGIDVLLDQTDFLVVGVVGPQGSGKSTILSLLAGTSPQDSYRNYVFKPQVKEVRENAGHETNGIDMFVTAERIIYLDTQPVMSASVMDDMIHNEKKYPTDYTSVENCIEMQSLQLATFLMTVCNVILVVEDWFTDLNFLRFILNAEMLKPSTPLSNHDGSGCQDEAPDYFPHIVFVQNKAGREDFSVESYRTMSQTLQQVLASSKLKHRGSVSMGSVMPGLMPSTVNSDINMFCLPHMEYYKTDQDAILSFLPEYRGCPSFSCLLKSLRNQILAMPRCLVTHTQLSEKNWFHYAARMWDTVRKSQLLAEYNRLLP